MAGLGPDANLLRFVKQHVMGKVGWGQLQIGWLTGWMAACCRADCTA